MAAPRPPEAILQAQRDAAQRQARAAELAGLHNRLDDLEETTKDAWEHRDDHRH